jgi:chromatin assembly factor 1 subunit A
VLISIDLLSSESVGRSPLDAMKVSSSRPRSTRYTRLHASAPVLKTISRVSVRDLIDQLNDATMAGDVSSAKALISTLSDRKQLPLRWLHFHENARPMYIGTWTKTARSVGPRTPFGKEEGVNYEYDSGEEWFEEEEGEEMEDLETIDGEEEEDEEDENNDWIVDDDEEELEQDDEGDLVLSLDEIGSGVIALPSKGKRKAEGSGYGFNGINKRRKLVPLKPSCKGPHWETVIGKSQISAWSQYSIRVLNSKTRITRKLFSLTML